GSRRNAGCQDGAAKGRQDGVVRERLGTGARRPSGRPGTRWLRVDREPLSTERPGPTRVAPSPGPTGAGGTPSRLKPSLAPEARALNLAPSGGAPVRHTAP